MARVKIAGLKSKERSGADNKKESSTRWIIVTGIVISIVISVVFLFLNQNYSLGLLIALVGIGVTLLLDISLGVKSNEELIASRTASLRKELELLLEEEGDDIKRAIKLGEYLARDTELRSTIEAIVGTCEQVKSLNVDVFTRKVDEYLKNCNKLINDLADGKEILKSDFSFLPSEHSPHKSVARVVMSTEPLYMTILSAGT